MRNAARGTVRVVHPVSAATAVLQLVPSVSTSVTCTCCRGPTPRSTIRSAVACAIAGPRAWIRSSITSDAV